MRKIALGLAALTFAASAAIAQTPLTFAEVDTDGNGELSFEELRAVWPDLTQEDFDRADVNMSGGLSPDELNALQPSTLPVPDAAPTAPEGTDMLAPTPSQ
ncbi:EF-hand domain-containing protein [Devosia chinhatensis]|uniref:EF-hand domain-containing protein n=1 Tax=Devosia chinhatensis TaxID=429727 RepID=A0A0F5FHM9_9HYPH|nr:EF-hand domain-containing protein [Devosia chinhatensis]KKB08303.1 hypothetical protein VE26_13770 [Devosia chinhatensis]